MDEYQLLQKQITNAINKYRKNRDKDIFKKIKNQLDMYHIYLQENLAGQEKYQWHAQQLKLINDLNMEKKLISNNNIKESPNKNNKDDIGNRQNVNAGLQYVKQIQRQVQDALVGGQRSLQKAIQVSNYIKIQLQRQIDVLDKVYEENLQMESRLNRVKQGLIIMLRRIMMNKLTRGLALLLVLAIIGLIVVYILKSNGTIK